MNTITQIYKNIIKTKIKESIITTSNEIVDAIVDNFDKNNNNYVSIVSSIQEKERELIKHILITTFEELDNNFKTSKERLKSYVVNKSTVPRTITTLFGDITFNRTYYKSKLDGSSHFILDECLGLVKYDRYDPIVKAFAINNYTKTNQSLSGEITGNQISSVNDIINKNTLNTIPRQSIHNWINKWNEPEVEYETRMTPETLYIMVDEKYIGCQDKQNDIMVKSYVTFEDVEKVSKNRNKLVNRLVFNTSSQDSWTEFSEFLYKVYDATKIKKIYVLSDGGKWITSNTEELKVEPNIIIKKLLCEFHFKQSLNRITTVELERKLLYEFFSSLSKKDFFTVLEVFKEKYKHKSDTIERQITYLHNHYTSIKDMLKSNIGSSMESHISHIVAAPFSSRPKGFSSIKIQKYLKINDYVKNGINILKLYLASYSDSTPNNININKSKNKNQGSRLESSPLPIINNGYMVQSYTIVKSIAYS